MIKTTPLESRHVALGAKMTEFAGYHMPVVYSGIQEEHQAVRNKVGIFDVSHMGEFIIKGRQALDLVQRISSNDASTLAVGQAQYACLPNENGGIVDDMLVYRLGGEMSMAGEEAYMLVVNASNIDKDWAHIQQYASEFDTRMINISEQTGLVAIQGPLAMDAMQPFTEINLRSIPYYHFAKGEFAGVENVIISNTGYTGAGGFELYTDNDHLPVIWDALMEAGNGIKPVPAGLGARDTLRLEMGFCLYGNDIDDTTSPLEAGLGWITKLKKESPFPSKEIFKNQKKQGITRKLVGIKVNDRRVPRHGYPVCDENGNEVGVITSGTLSPTLQIPIGMAYIPTFLAVEGTPLQVIAGSKVLGANVTAMPFVKSTTLAAH